MTPTSKGLPRAARSAMEVGNRRVVIKVKHILETIVVLFLVFGLITWQVSALSEASRQGDLREAREASYRAELVAYQIAEAQFEACQGRIETRVINRERFLASNLAMRAIIDTYTPIPARPVDVAVYLILDTELEAIITEIPLLDESICLAAPVRPARPNDTEGG